MNKKILIAISIFVVIIAGLLIFRCYIHSNDRQYMILKIASKFGEAHPKIVSIKPDTEESTHKRMYFITLKGNFKNGTKTANGLIFSVMGDYKHAWCITGYNLSKNEMVWTDTVNDVYNNYLF